MKPKARVALKTKLGQVYFDNQKNVRFLSTADHGVRGVSQIKFTISDSFRVFFDFDILSMIKKKTPFDFYCVILIMNLSRLISQMTLLISKICPFDFSNDTFDFQNWSRLISQMTLLISRICPFDFQNLSPRFDFSNDTFVRLISKICRV